MVALKVEAVPRREMGVRPVVSDFEIAPVLCLTGVLVPAAGGSVLGLLSFTSLCALGMEETVDLAEVPVRGVGVLGDMLTELWDLGDMVLCRGLVTGLGVDRAPPALLTSVLLLDRGVLVARLVEVPALFSSALLLERGVLADRPRVALPKVPGPLTPVLPILPRLLLRLIRLPLLPLLFSVLLGLFLIGLSNSVLPEEHRDPLETDFFSPRAAQE